MPTETETVTETDTTATGPAPTDAIEPTMRRSVLRAARRVATPASIVIAWIVVVTQWNESDTALFNWATTTAGVVLGVVTVLWLVSLRFPALRRALLPFEGGLVVAAVVLAWATGGREVDLLGDRVAIAVGFGIVAAMLLAFMQQLVAGRDRAWAWLTGVMVLCAAAGIVVPATLDWLDRTSSMLPYESQFTGELVGRSSSDGFRLDDVTMLYDAPALGGGYIDVAAAAMYGAGYATPAIAIDPATNGPVTIDSAAASGMPVDPEAPATIDAAAAVATPDSGTEAAAPAPVPDPSMPGAIEGTTSVPTIRNDWGRLLARPNGSIHLVVQPKVTTGVTGTILGSLRRGGCDQPGGKELLSLTLGRSSAARVDRAVPIKVDDLRIDDQLSFVIGTAEPLAPTRCTQLLSGTGIALAQLGAATFNAECLEPLDLPRGSEYLVRPSTFQDASCAKRFEAYGRISSALLVPGDSADAYRTCRRTREQGMVTTEQQLPNGAIAVTYTDYNPGLCSMYGVNSGIFNGYPTNGIAMASPVNEPYASSDPAAEAAPSAPLAPSAGAVATEDLDGISPDELAAKVR